MEWKATRWKVGMRLERGGVADATRRYRMAEPKHNKQSLEVPFGREGDRYESIWKLREAKRVEKQSCYCCWRWEGGGGATRRRPTTKAGAGPKTTSPHATYSAQR